MARIFLNIEAEDATDLKLTLLELAGSSTVRQMVEDGEVDLVRDDPEPDAGARQDAEPGERTRFKRTRDEIARGLTVEQAKAERAAQVAGADSASSGSATAAQTASQENTASTPQTSSPQSDAGPAIDPFAEPAPKTTTPSPTTSAASQDRALTLQDLRAAMSGYLAKNDDAGAMQALMAAHFKTEEGEPVMRASQLQTKDYAAAIELLSA